MPIGVEPTGTVAGVCPQPEAFWPLQVAPLNTDTVLSRMLATYTVSVFSSIVTALGRFPTVIVGHGPPQREASCASQRRVSITETVFPPAFGPSSFSPFATYSVWVASSNASAPGPFPTGADPTSADPKPSPPRGSNAAANPRWFPSLPREPK